MHVGGLRGSMANMATPTTQPLTTATSTTRFEHVGKPKNRAHVSMSLSLQKIAIRDNSIQPVRHVVFADHDHDHDVTIPFDDRKKRQKKRKKASLAGN